MPSSTSKMAASSQLFINHLLPKGAHLAIVCGQTGCGKTVFILSLLQEGPYRGFVRHILVLCPTIEHNKTYKQCPWLLTDPEVYVLDPSERLHDYLRSFYLMFKGEPTLFYNWRLLGHKGSDEEERHAVRVSLLGPPRWHKRLGPHPEIQLSPEGLARADALGRTLPLQGSRLLWRLPAGERRDTDSRTVGVGAAAASWEKTLQASVENRSACCLWWRRPLGLRRSQLYAGVAAMFLPIENQPRFIADLEGDLFVGHALSSATCELYHR